MPSGWDPDDPEWRGLSIAPNDTLFSTTPTWERIDTGAAYDAGVRVKSVTIDRGRQDEFDRAKAGSMTIELNDRPGFFDPTNTGSAYFGLTDRVPIAFSVRNPVTNQWWPRWRGYIDDIVVVPDKRQQINRITITALGWFSYLNGFKLAPGHGDYVNAQVNSSGFIFYEDTDFQTRGEQLLEDASVTSGLSTVFTGNIDVQESRYNPGDTIMSAIWELIDAEFPTVGQIIEDKEGFLCLHGRESRFSPDVVAATATHWDFNRWKAGDGAAIALDDEVAQIRPPYSVRRPIDKVLNAALAYPIGMDRSLFAAQALYSPGSIATYGTRSWEAPNLIILEDTTNGLDGPTACQAIFAGYILANYAVPRNRVEAVTLRPLDPEDRRAAATWAMLCRVDISDIVNLRVSHAGGGGLLEDFYVEGIRETWSPLHGGLDASFPNVLQTLNMSPKSYWTSLT